MLKKQLRFFERAKAISQDMDKVLENWSERWITAKDFMSNFVRYFLIGVVVLGIVSASLGQFGQIFGGILMWLSGGLVPFLAGFGTLLVVLGYMVGAIAVTGQKRVRLTHAEEKGHSRVRNLESELWQLTYNADDDEATQPTRWPSQPQKRSPPSPPPNSPK